MFLKEMVKKININFTIAAVFFIVLFSLFFRLYKIDETMPFIGDQAWFYLSARDIITEGKIPLVGITSSDVRFHQGPIWTYLLTVPLFISSFNPISPAFLAAFIDAITVVFLFFLGKKMFSKNFGFILALLYAFSPIVIFNSRMPYHTSPIPFFVLLYIFSLTKFIEGKILFFPLTVFFISILYNFELASYVFIFPLILYLFLFIKNKNKIINKVFSVKILFLSFLGFIIPMAPFLIYDFNNQFIQTLGFTWYVVKKPISILFLEGSLGFNYSMISFFLDFLKRLIFASSWLISLIVFLFSITMLIYSLIKSHKEFYSFRGVLGCILLIAILGTFINQVPSQAYLPMFFIPVLSCLALFLEKLTKNKLKILSYLLLGLIVLANGISNFHFFSKQYENEMLGISKRLDAVEKIIRITNGRPYNLVGKGLGSEFKSFTMNYEYLLWLKGNPPSNVNQKIKIVIKDASENIIIMKE